MINKLLKQECVILNPVLTDEDDDGDVVEAFANTSGKTWACRVEAATDQEHEVDRDTRTSTANLYLSRLADGFITALSRVTCEGITYQVVGEPNLYRKRSRPSHVEVSLRVILG